MSEIILNFIENTDYVDNNILWFSSAMSSMGQYQLLIDRTAEHMIYSDSYGETWKNITLPSPILTRTNNYGYKIRHHQGWVKGDLTDGCVGYHPEIIFYDNTDISECNVTASLNNFTAPLPTLAISDSGQYQTVVDVTGCIRCSGDFGELWTIKENLPTNCELNAVKCQMMDQFK